MPAVCGNPRKQPAEGIVQPDIDQNDRQIIEIKIAVEPQRHTGQEEIGQSVFFIKVKSVPAEQYDGQKDKNKNI